MGCGTVVALTVLCSLPIVQWVQGQDSLHQENFYYDKEEEYHVCLMGHRITLARDIIRLLPGCGLKP